MRLEDVKVASLPVRPGELIGDRYRVEKVLGQGGMAVVVSAKDERLDEIVALKVLLPERVTSSDARERFTREARTAVRIKNEHVVRVTDVGELRDGTPYMVMEYLEGEDLATLLARKRRVPAPTAMFYVLQVCSALKEAHGLGVVHRDLKPANLFLAKKRGQPPSLKVLDFGISKAEHHDRRRTETKEILGSPWYMAPEQMKRASSADARADVWSLGIILHELVTGEVPFDGATMTEVIVTVLHDEPRISHVGDMPPALEKVIRRCLAKSPDDRYASADALAEALREADVPESMPSLEGNADDEGEVVDESELIPSVKPPRVQTSAPPSKNTAAAALSEAAAAITAQEESEAQLAAEVEMLPPSIPPPAVTEDLEPTTGVLPPLKPAADRQRTTMRPRQRPADPAPVVAAPAKPQKPWASYAAVAAVVFVVAWVASRREQPSTRATTTEPSPAVEPAAAVTPTMASERAAEPEPPKREPEPVKPEPAKREPAPPPSETAATSPPPPVAHAPEAPKPAAVQPSGPVAAAPKPAALTAAPKPATPKPAEAKGQALDLSGLVGGGSPSPNTAAPPSTPRRH